MIRIVAFVYLILVVKATGQSPTLVSFDNEFIGELNDNPYAINSISNPYGRYGSEYSSISVNNPYGKYGSEYSVYSPNSEFSVFGSPNIYAYGGAYLGKLSKNQFAEESTGNDYGYFGNEYNPNSINNPSGLYGSDYSLFSSTFLFGRSFFDDEQQTKRNSSTIKNPFKTNEGYSFLFLNAKDILKKRDLFYKK
jgi:hypothetical protein